MASEPSDPGLNSAPNPVYLAFVEELAAHVPVWHRMLAEHLPNQDGLCTARVCGRGGYGTPHLRWPCPARSLADQAHQTHLGRTGQELRPGRPAGRAPVIVVSARGRPHPAGTAPNR